MQQLLQENPIFSQVMAPQMMVVEDRLERLDISIDQQKWLPSISFQAWQRGVQPEEGTGVVGSDGCDVAMLRLPFNCWKPKAGESFS